MLSLGRNALKSIQGIEAAADTLEQVWISYNQIDKLKPLRNLLKLKASFFFSFLGGADNTQFLYFCRHNQCPFLCHIQVLYISHNYIKDWREFEHMTELPLLEDFVFIGNPLEEELTASGKYTEEIIKRLLYIKVAHPVIRYPTEQFTILEPQIHLSTFLNYTK